MAPDLQVMLKVGPALSYKSVVAVLPPQDDIGISVKMTYKTLIGTLLICLSISSPTRAQAVDPYAQPDESQAALSGTLSKIRGDDFWLDYGDGEIAIELVDWERGAQELGLREGLQVTVYGEIDTDFFTATSVEAQVVYVKHSNSYYYATGDEQLSLAYRKAHEWSEPNYYEISDMTLRGKVSSVSKDEGTFSVKMRDGNEITVETAGLNYDPLSSEMLKPIRKGDSVSVSGRIDYAFLKGKVLVADTVTALR